MNAHFRSTLCHERLAVTSPVSTTLLVPFTFLAYTVAPIHTMFLFPLLSLSIALFLPPILQSLPTHMLLCLLFRSEFSLLLLLSMSLDRFFLVFPTAPVSLALQFSFQSSDYSIVSQVVCIYISGPVF